ncbi:MAG: ABC transporter ATP-binding protein [archaeon]
MQPIIKLDDAWKVYQMGEVEVPAIRGISLDVRKGEFLAIAGPSGSGKSTVMNLVGCLDLPTKGKIYLAGKDIESLTESDLAQTRGKQIGFIFQQFNLIPTLTALENVMLPLEIQDVDTGVARKKSAELLTLVGLGDRMRHLPSQLSGGERQRVAIARALSVDPDIILADEPTGNLDSKSGEFIMKFLSDIHKKKGTTLIIVTHDLHLVQYAERIVYLKDGQVERITQNKRRRKKE